MLIILIWNRYNSVTAKLDTE